LDPYIVGHYRLEVANDVFNDVGIPGLIVLPRHPQSATWLHVVGPRDTVAGTCEWPTALALHCNHTLAVYLHVFQALIVLPTCTSCRAMMALTSGVLKTCVRALRTREISCIGRSVRLFFMLNVMVLRKPQGMRWWHRSPLGRVAGSGAIVHTAPRSPPLPGGNIRSYRTCGAQEPSPAGR
jgi:hypothetical protein